MNDQTTLSHELSVEWPLIRLCQAKIITLKDCDTISWYETRKQNALLDLKEFQQIIHEGYMEEERQIQEEKIRSKNGH